MSVCLFVCLPVCLSACLPVCLFVGWFLGLLFLGLLVCCNAYCCVLSVGCSVSVCVCVCSMFLYIGRLSVVCCLLVVGGWKFAAEGRWLVLSGSWLWMTIPKSQSRDPQSMDLNQTELMLTSNWWHLPIARICSISKAPH